uniref:Uncharacterized protein n=1 Tax=Caenorhabditis tropicalis TaxID=1561998 RepID=A0A1I7SZL7_9PELO
MAALLLPPQHKHSETLVKLRLIRDVFEKKFPEMIGKDNGYRFRRTVEYDGVRKSIWASGDPSKNYELFLECTKERKTQLKVAPKIENIADGYDEDETRKAVDSILEDYEHCDFNFDFAHGYINPNTLHLPTEKEIQEVFPAPQPVLEPASLQTQNQQEIDSFFAEYARNQQQPSTSALVGSFQNPPFSELWRNTTLNPVYQPAVMLQPFTPTFGGLYLPPPMVFNQYAPVNNGLLPGFQGFHF